jgi:hypothetical protein
MFGQLNTDSVTGQLNGCTPNKQRGEGRALDQAVSRGIGTAVARVRVQVRARIKSCGIFMHEEALR